MTDTPKFAKAKRAVRRALRARGIALVEIPYDGEGDNGQIGYLCAFSAKDRQVDIDQPVRLALRDGEKPTRYASLRDALEDFAWLVLDHYHGGFENNDGGYGDITICTARRAVVISHNDRVMEAVNTTTEA
jgi:hypothetical protein